MEVRFKGNHECKRGVGPTGTEDLRVGCSVALRATLKLANGKNVPQRRTGNDMVWQVVQGAA